MGRLLLLATLLCVTSRAATATVVQIYVLTGQSNSLGPTSDPSETDSSADSDASDADTRLFWTNYAANGSPFSTSGYIRRLEMQQGDGNSNPMFWGPEIGFARTMAQYGESDVMIVKVSRTGGGNTNWSKEAHQSDPLAGEMYQNIVTAVNTATSSLTQSGIHYTINGLLYLQGESDTPEEAAVAGERFSALLNNLRTDLPRASEMVGVIAGIAAAGPTRDVTRAGQEAVALADPKISYFSDLDLASSLYDELHFNKSAKLEIGRRFADDIEAYGELHVTDTLGDLSQTSLDTPHINNSPKDTVIAAGSTYSLASLSVPATGASQQVAVQTTLGFDLIDRFSTVHLPGNSSAISGDSLGRRATVLYEGRAADGSGLIDTMKIGIALPGDLDFDGDVDFDDAFTLINNYGISTGLSWRGGDLDGDGDVDFDDAFDLINEFDQQYALAGAPPAGNALVSEPSSATVTVIGVVLLGAIRYRRRTGSSASRLNLR